MNLGLGGFFVSMLGAIALLAIVKLMMKIMQTIPAQPMALDAVLGTTQQ